MMQKRGQNRSFSLYNFSSKNRRGLSTIIVTLILILVSLVAVGIVWVVVRNIIQTGTEGVGLSQFSLSAKILDVAIDNSSNNVSLTVKRNAGEGDLIGISFVFSSGENNEVITRNVSLKELEQMKFYFHLINTSVSDLTSVSIVPLIRQDEKQITGIALDKYNFGNSKNNIQLQACVPTNCSALGYVCGTWNNGTCAGTLNCGNCTGGQICNASGRCVADTSAVLCEPNTYYIDFVNGNDNNNGTCSNSAWKRQPYMNGFSGSYTHHAGDKFIFKGGVTWPNACFRMNVQYGGTGESARDYYGVDARWYSGGSWARPIWDMQNAQTATNNQVMSISANYITVDNIEVVNFYWTGPQSYGKSFMFPYGTSQYITFTNLYIHSWSHDTSASGTNDDMKVFVGQTGFNPSNGIIIGNSVFDGTPNGVDSGMMVYGGVSIIRNNIMHDMSNAIVVGAGIPIYIYNNTIYNIHDSFDPTNHENAIEMLSAPSYIYNNYVHDLASGTMPIFTVPNGNAAGSYDYVYNNVIWNTGFQPPISVDTNGGGPLSSSSEYIFGNTLIADSGTCIRIVQRGTGNLAALVLKNNHCVGGTLYCGDGGSGCAGVNNPILSNNALQTLSQANAQGYTVSNLYAPINSNGITVNSGTSLLAGDCPSCSGFTSDILRISRPQGSAWDIGAYEYNGVSGSNIYASSCSQINVQNAINSASDGDTVVVPAGTCTWSSTLTITKGITMRGAGIGKTNITGNIDYIMPTPSLYTLFRLTGFSLTGLVNLMNINQYNIGRARIDHNALTSLTRIAYTGTVIRTGGQIYGVIDHNIIDMGDCFYIFGDDNHAWSNVTFAYGTEATLFVEDNNISMASSVNGMFQDSGVGTMFVLRYNNYNFDAQGSSTYEQMWDMHGNQGTGSNSATMGAEIYGNKLVSTTGTNIEMIDQRGGELMLFWNKIAIGTPSVYIQSREECDDCLNGHSPCVGPSGEPMHVSNSYYWNNRYGTNLITNHLVINGGRSDCIAPTYNIALGVDVFNDNGNGMSCGTLAARPATCTVGQGYWATNQSCSSINDSNIGKNPSAPISGTMYKCNATNTWIVYYTPYTYPHPLTLIP